PRAPRRRRRRAPGPGGRTPTPAPNEPGRPPSAPGGERTTPPARFPAANLSTNLRASGALARVAILVAIALHPAPPRCRAARPASATPGRTRTATHNRLQTRPSAHAARLIAWLTRT